MKTFLLHDRPTLAERKALGIECELTFRDCRFLDKSDRQLVAVLTGERRAMKAGEWYVSGAIPAAYRTPNDTSMEQAIARLIIVKNR